MAKAPKNIRAYLAAIGEKGGKTRAKRLTAEQRREGARKAAIARWAKHRVRNIAQR